jgi:hypothetical protein
MKSTENGDVKKIIKIPANQQVTCKALESQFCKCFEAKFEALAIALFSMKTKYEKSEYKSFR